MAYKAEELARYVINKCIEFKRPITNLRLQHILYLLNIESVKAGRGLAFPDQMESNQYGARVPKIHTKYSCYIRKISDKQKGSSLPEEAQEFFDPFVKRYSKMSGIEITRSVLDRNGPQHRAFKGVDRSVPIPEEYFLELHKKTS